MVSTRLTEGIISLTRKEEGTPIGGKREERKKFLRRESGRGKTVNFPISSVRNERRTGTEIEGPVYLNGKKREGALSARRSRGAKGHKGKNLSEKKEREASYGRRKERESGPET